MSNRRKITAARRVQYGALPYRLSAGSRPQFMLVTSRETRRWIIPKGSPKKGKSPHHSAAREAFEEAGVGTNPNEQPLCKRTVLVRFCPNASLNACVRGRGCVG